MRRHSQFKGLASEDVEHLLSDFLIDSWSYSKVTAYARHPKAFEMNYIFNEKSKSSATTVAGQAYHYALDKYFSAIKENLDGLDCADLEILAFNYIEELSPNAWKLQKTTPTVAEAKIKAVTTANALIKNFLGELSTYMDDIEQIVDVEVYCDEFLVINGVDIPLPCHSKIDLVVKLKDGKHVIIDHKSKGFFTSDEELAMAVGIQGITYVNSYEAKTGLEIDEVWFIENKYSQNRDKSPQLNCHRITVDADTRALYESLLYEPLRAMIAAVNDPDFVYLINQSDNFVDMAEIYDFWSKTMVCEVEEFDIPEAKRELISKRLKKIRDASVKIVNPSVIKKFRENANEFIQYDLSNKNMTEEEKIEHALRSFGTVVRVAHKFDGYSSDTYLLEVSAGVKVSSISSHRLDIANVLNVSNVRIAKELTVYEGKSYLAIDFAKKREKDLPFDPKALVGQRIPLGKDNYGNTIVWDLDNQSTPHLLCCGATGSGKSVEIRCVIEYAKLAKIPQIIILDPKYEFTQYAGKKNIEVYNDIEDIEAAMYALVQVMNDRVESGTSFKTLVVFDEFADALSQARKTKDLKVYETVEVGMYANGKPKLGKQHTQTLKTLEENLKIIVQKGRSVGLRVLAATQRASTQVITGDAKANFPALLCFRVPKEIDSRVVLDEPGAESLAGKGDGLFRSPEYPETVRFQSYFIK